jgi:hypothetical protein
LPKKTGEKTGKKIGEKTVAPVLKNAPQITLKTNPKKPD